MIRILLVLVLLTGINNVIGAALGPEAWLDDKGQAAPGSVRQAADDLWSAVKTEGKVAFESGWGVTKQAPLNPAAVCGCLCGCALTLGYSGLCGLLDYCCNDVEYGTFNHRDSGGFMSLCEGESCNPEKARDNLNEERRLLSKAEVAATRVKDASAKFKNAVNSAVLRPEEYSGDVDIFTLGQWVEDGAQQQRNCAPYRFHEIVSARHSGTRDLSTVPQSVMAFVNVREGWDSKKRYALVIPTYQSDMNRY